ncbi:MAG: MBL fold metallo-hydrolase [Clostridia bacterium]|nr:MBL fold metallo-hydrolase [Clostridia bacterium]
MSNMMSVKYLYHSGVSVSYKNRILIFDYFKKGFESKELDSYEEVFIFVSHRHKDHFDNEILKWNQLHENIHYIFSSDISQKFSLKNITFMGPDEKRTVNDLFISTYRSTDEGVAFLVETESGNIFHSGDLNWWHWEEDDEKNNQLMKMKFIEEISKLKNMKIDIAFIPVDQRLSYAKYYAIDYLMENVSVRKVFPIHLFDDYSFLTTAEKDLSDRAYYDKISFYKEGQNEV